MSNRLSVNHLLISTLAKRKTANNPLQAGFTLVELLIVVIIIAILASVALPAFLNQSDKAKAAAAKSLSSAGAKECQVWLVEQETAWGMTTRGGGQVNIADPGCSPTAANTFAAIVTRAGGNWTYSATVASSGAITAKACTAGSPGCGTGTFAW